MIHYIVAWTGGYEAPCYEYRATQAEALILVKEWLAEMGERDTIDLLVVSTEAGTIARLDVCKHCGKVLHNETFDAQTFLIDDETGGDVCGWDGGNEPHESA